jgi:hypothetical protein
VLPPRTRLPVTMMSAVGSWLTVGPASGACVVSDGVVCCAAAAPAHSIAVSATPVAILVLVFMVYPPGCAR